MEPTWILLRNGSIIDGSGAPARRGTVLIRNNRIHALGEKVDEQQLPKDGSVHVIDATGKTVMPGLIDAHCHMSYGESWTQDEQDIWTSHERRTLVAASNAARVLRAGVTSISQPGGSHYIGVGIREGIKDGLVLGPRMTAAGRYITTSNGLTDWYPDEVGVPDSSIGKLANTADEMISEVRHQVKNGVDFIKLADSPYGEYQAFTNDELKAVADLSHQLKKKVTIHARGPAEVDAAVGAGFDWIMHGNVMTDDVIGRLAASKITLIPTLLLLANLSQWGHLVGAHKGMIDGTKRMLDKTGDTLHRARKAGVVFGMGTDSGFAVTPYGEWHARELELLMEYAGLSSMEAIIAGTKNGAKMMNLEGKVGEIREGALADVIVVNGDPVKDIRVLQRRANIETVIKNGVVVEFDEADLARRRHHDRGIVYSQGDLLYSTVYGNGEVKPGSVRKAIHEMETPQVGTPIPYDGEEGHDLVSDLERRNAGAGEEDE
jgi:imidazolonepropionase-like amidohydrolase